MRRFAQKRDKSPYQRIVQLVKEHHRICVLTRTRGWYGRRRVGAAEPHVQEQRRDHQ